MKIEMKSNSKNNIAMIPDTHTWKNQWDVVNIESSFLGNPILEKMDSREFVTVY